MISGKIVTDKIEDISILLLLPLFFVITGLRTQVGLLNAGNLWITFGWILLVAVTGKFGGSALAAKIVGQSWRDSLSIGVLMHTRGLMQLIVLNIGYDLGILSPEIFAMMDEGREPALDVSPVGVDGVMSRSFSKDDACVVWIVCMHCQGFL